MEALMLNFTVIFIESESCPQYHRQTVLRFILRRIPRSAIGCVVDGCPPGLEIGAEDIQLELDRRKPGTSRHVTQRRESDTVEILSGVFEGKTTGTQSPS